MDDLQQKILADLQQTGFISELKVGSLFAKRGWSVSHGTSFFDTDSGKSRELDIIATRSLQDKEINFNLIFQLVVQVKTSHRPWVIFSSPRPIHSIGWSLAHHEENFIISEHLPYPQVSEEIMRRNKERVGTAFHEAFKSPKEPSQTYEAVVSACKATTFQIQQYRLGWGNILKNEDQEFDPNLTKWLYIFCPLVILEGVLFESHLDTNGDIQLEQQDFIPVNFTYSQIKKYQTETIEGPGSTRYFPDIIRATYIDTYLTLVDHWRQDIFTKATRNLRYLLGNN